MLSFDISEKWRVPHFEKSSGSDPFHSTPRGDCLNPGRGYSAAHFGTTTASRSFKPDEKSQSQNRKLALQRWRYFRKNAKFGPSQKWHVRRVLRTPPSPGELQVCARRLKYQESMIQVKFFIGDFGLHACLFGPNTESASHHFP